MDDRVVTYIEGSEKLVGYRTKIWKRDPFRFAGYSVFVPPNEEGHPIPHLWKEMVDDGRIEALRKASSVPAWIMGLGESDPGCPPNHWRHTIGIEENAHTDFPRLTEKYKQPLHRQSFEACEWMCFEMTSARFSAFCNKDNPYEMLRKLGWRFHWRVGVHFDSYPPSSDTPFYDFAGKSPDAALEFWISVAKQTEECDVCPWRETCGKAQPFA